jgi:hypothetical protein
MYWKTHVILDTCVWIDLVNKNQEIYLDLLDDLIDKEHITLVIPEQVSSEWNKNREDKIIKEKESTYEQLKEKLKVLGIITKTAKIDDLEDQLHSFKLSLERNKEKVLNTFTSLTERVDKLLNHKNNIIIHLNNTDKVKDQVIEFALKRKAPFTNKNSVGDAIIFFSSLEYSLKSRARVLFVSTNHKDFGEKSSSELHKDLKEVSKDSNFTYFNSLSDALIEIKEYSADIIELLSEESTRMREYERDDLESIGSCDRCGLNHKDLLGYYLYDIRDVAVLAYCQNCYQTGVSH